MKEFKYAFVARHELPPSGNVPGDGRWGILGRDIKKERGFPSLDTVFKTR
jgi:hypothetical protein